VAKQQGDGQVKRGRGRPKGTGRGGLETRFACKISAEYETWLVAYAAWKKCDRSELFREGMKLVAARDGFREPPTR
jgi:hypothetical protein